MGGQSDLTRHKVKQRSGRSRDTEYEAVFAHVRKPDLKYVIIYLIESRDVLCLNLSGFTIADHISDDFCTNASFS